jgi:hypothetical protein
LHANDSRCRPRGTPHFSCAMSACHDRTIDHTGDIEHLQDTCISAPECACGARQRLRPG